MLQQSISYAHSTHCTSTVYVCGWSRPAVRRAVLQQSISYAHSTHCTSTVCVGVVQTCCEERCASTVHLICSQYSLYYTVSPQKTCDYIFYNNFNNTCSITAIFGTVSSKSMCHRKIVSFPTSPI